MDITAFSQSKYRDRQSAGDDSMLIVPESVIALFDGATDHLHEVEDYVSAGRVASRAAAQICAKMFGEMGMKQASTKRLLSAISKRFYNRIQDSDSACHPSTTMAMALFFDSDSGEKFGCS